MSIVAISDYNLLSYVYKGAYTVNREIFIW